MGLISLDKKELVVNLGPIIMSMEEFGHNKYNRGVDEKIFVKLRR